MSWVFVVESQHRPRDPVQPGAARRLLSRGQAAVWRRAPFPLILKPAVPDGRPQPVRLKLDPGSRTTGLALVSEAETTLAAAQERARTPQGEPQLQSRQRRGRGAGDRPSRVSGRGALRQLCRGRSR